ncbi:MAG: hypothetical protein VXX39_00960 [Candidatus Thermoplasmatota archaeon]|nr:hypothetical protein [Candidatus Thermoplasmatota archaeon]
MKYSKALILTFLIIAMTLSGCTGPTVTLSDADGDGVIDALDLCPNTPPNTQVNSNGCEERCADFKVWDDMRDEFEYFGADVQTDGRSVIVGAPDEYDGGKAFVYKCETLANIWLHEDELVPTSVGLSADDNFGHSVSIFGDYAIVGNPGHDILSNGSTLPDAGAAFIFKRGTTGLWSEVTMLQEPSLNQDANFGWSVDISSNAIDRSGDYDIPIPGTQFNAVVGAPTSNAVNGNMTGAAYFFTTDSAGVAFANVVRLEASPQWHNGSMLYNGPLDDGGYGTDVAVYGNTAVIGSPVEVTQIQTSTSTNRPPHSAEYGAAYIFEGVSIPQGVTSLQETLRFNKPDFEHCDWLDPANQGVLYSGATHPICNNNDHFGHSVDIYDDIIVIGEPGGPMSWSCWGTIRHSNGAVYVFEKNESSPWQETVYVKLEPSVNTEYPFQNHQNFTFNTHAFGWEVEVDRDMILVASPVRNYYFTSTAYGPLNVGPSHGSSYLFQKDAPMSWNEVAIIGIPDIIYPPNYNGFMFNEQGIIHNQIALGGSYIVIGSQYDDIRPVNWIPWSYSGTWTAPGTPPTDSPDPNQNGKDTGSAYICWFDEIQNVYCDWTEETNQSGNSFSWGSYSIAKSNQSSNENMSQWLGMECPYQDDNICRIMGYLYSEEFASLYHDAEPAEFLCDDLDDSNRTTQSFKESYLLECFEIYDSNVDDGDENEEEQSDSSSGCTDPDANNYDEDAEVDDDSCTYGNDDEAKREEQQTDS